MEIGRKRMFLFIDIMPRTKELKIIQETCPSCREYGDVHLVKTANCLRLFFIPIFSWGAIYTLMHDCGSRMIISEDDAIALMYAGVSFDQIAVEIALVGAHKCTKCGRILEADFLRCPYCKK